MKTLLILLGLVTFFLGIWPFLEGLAFLSFLSFIPSSGTIYSVIIAAVGAIALFVGFRS